jgi:hypothetical protein
MPGGLDLSAAAENAPQNSGRERDSLITVEISLIARFNSLQGAGRAWLDRSSQQIPRWSKPDANSRSHLNEKPFRRRSIGFAGLR